MFHFVGHGGFDQSTGEGLVALVGEEGDIHRLSATQLGALLGDHHPLRLAVLNSCDGARGSKLDVFSSTAATLVRRGTPAVLAMQYEITDLAAIELARSFYDAVADGLAVDSALAAARQAVWLELGNTLEWGTPVLYMRSVNGVLFHVEERKRDRPEAKHHQVKHSVAPVDAVMRKSAPSQPTFPGPPQPDAPQQYRQNPQRSRPPSFCRRCGEARVGQARFCNGCGERFS